ncbi:MAG TPA: hypothetical protein VF581_02570 [Flavobacterium sp.]|jgi:hypothetical protein
MVYTNENVIELGLSNAEVTVLNTSRYAWMSTRSRFLASVEVLAYIDFLLNVNQTCKKLKSELVINDQVFHKLIECILKGQKLSPAELLDFVRQLKTAEQFLVSTQDVFNVSFDNTLSYNLCFVAFGFTLEDQEALKNGSPDAYGTLEDVYFHLFCHDLVELNDVHESDHINKVEAAIRNAKDRLQEMRNIRGNKK